MERPLYFSHPACLEHETPAGHPERPARITALESSLAERRWLGYEVREAPPASREMLVAVHSAEYVDAVRSMSDRGGGTFDQENIVSAGSYDAAAHASGAGCAMVEALLAGGGPRVGFCAPRPPGHHARTDTTSGFCLFNHVAVASRHALDSLGVRRVFIFDWDVHHGDGTNDIFRATDAVLFASIHQSGAFPGTGASGDSLRAFLLDCVEDGATVISDGWPSYRPATAGLYAHERLVGSRREASQLLPGPHRVASLAKRWLLGTHQGSVEDSHLASYLDEFVFRFNRRRSRSRGMLFYRVLELAVAHDPVRYRDLIVNPRPTARPRRAPGTRGRPASLERPPANRPWRAVDLPSSG